MDDAPRNRRQFLILGAAALTTWGLDAGRLAASSSRRRSHPDPRPGIDGSKVLPSDGMPAGVGELYDDVRRIPRVMDGIGCQCGCADVPGMYSLLSCYEESGMAMYCDICQRQGRLVVRLSGEGRSLAEIRAAVDRRFG